MAGTKIGGQKAAAKNLAKNPNFYKEIGLIGGQKGTTGGFCVSGKSQSAGALGGQRSKRGYKFLCENDEYMEYMDKSNDHYGETVKFYK